MKNIQVIDCLQPELVTLEKVNYFPRQLLTVDDMVTERDYVLQKMRRHNRFLHGWGVVCGLLVKPIPTPTQPWLVQIGGGYALGPYGDEIYVVEPTTLDLAKCGPKAMTDPCDPERMRPAATGVGGTIYVAIKYAECFSRPVQAMPTGCGCEDEPCEYSRIRDSYQVTCLTELPPSHRPPRQPSLCDIVSGVGLPACPPCPADPWVVLAQVHLPASPQTQLVDANIDNRAFRRLIFSVAMIQDQLIACCCGERHQPPVQDQRADLEIKFLESNRVGQAPDAPSGGVEFVLQVTNHGPSAADNVEVTIDTNPAMDNVRFGWIPDPLWTPIGGKPANGIQSKLGTLASGANKQLAFKVKVLRGNKTLEAKGTVSSTTTDPDPSSNAGNRTHNF